MLLNGCRQGSRKPQDTRQVTFLEPPTGWMTVMRAGLTTKTRKSTTDGLPCLVSSDSFLRVKLRALSRLLKESSQHTLASPWHHSPKASSLSKLSLVLMVSFEDPPKRSRYSSSAHCNYLIEEKHGCNPILSSPKGVYYRCTTQLPSSQTRGRLVFLS